jgi:hypothetical protein
MNSLFYMNDGARMQVANPRYLSVTPADAGV